MQTTRLTRAVELYRGLLALKAAVGSEKELLGEVLDTMIAARRNLTMELNLYRDRTDAFDDLVQSVDDIS